MTQQMLRITGTKDMHMWYARMVGQLVPLLGVWPGEGYKSREPAGHINIVYFDDAEIEWVQDIEATK